jgi:DNA-nicking Smr family endonuclease
MFINRATQAYLQGNRAAARALSRTAQELNSQVSNLHLEAAKNIFYQRNSQLDSRSRPVIDLHGLHSGEAIDLLEDSLKSLGNNRYKGDVVIVTGTGHHSRGGKVKVLPAVRQHLEQSGRAPKDASLSDGRGGMLIIKI